MEKLAQSGDPVQISLEGLLYVVRDDVPYIATPDLTPLISMDQLRRVLGPSLVLRWNEDTQVFYLFRPRSGD